MKPRTVDTKTRFQNVYARHKLQCALATDGKKCTCEPSYFGVAWDRDAGKHRKTKFRPRAAEAKDLLDELRREIREGTFNESSSGLSLEDVRERFIEAVCDGIALNKKGKPYKKKARINLESSLKKLPRPMLHSGVGEVRKGSVQRMVDDLHTDGLSGSRIRSIVNALRSLYRWAEDRDLVNRNPASRIRLPAYDSSERERIAKPMEFANLLKILDARDAVPWALAAYGTARSQEIRHLEWPEVDLKHRVLLLAEDEAGRKSEAARRIVPMVRQLATILREEWLRQGRPKAGRVCPPRRASVSGMLSLDQLQKGVRATWEEAGLEPIGLQDSRHTAATWLDHAKVSPKVSSQFMGHKTPEPQPGAAAITLGRYTHVLDGELERARDQLEAFLARREADEARKLRARRGS